MADLGEDRAEHRLSEAAGSGVVARAMIAAKQAHGTLGHVDIARRAMAEGGAGQALAKRP